jgi:hypothetical protein
VRVRHEGESGEFVGAREDDRTRCRCKGEGRGEQSTRRRVHCLMTAWVFLRNVDDRRVTTLITSKSIADEGYQQG